MHDDKSNQIISMLGKIFEKMDSMDNKIDSLEKDVKLISIQQLEQFKKIITIFEQTLKK